MIYTQYGVGVKIVAYNDEEQLVGVQSVEDPSWQRWKPIITLKADQGIDEVQKAIDSLDK